MTTPQILLALIATGFTAIAMGYFAIQHINYRDFWTSVFYVTAFFTMTTCTIEWLIRLIQA